jgi:hypothetical protein
MIKHIAKPRDNTRKTIDRVFNIPITINLFDLTIEDIDDYNAILLTGLDHKILKNIADYFSVNVRNVTDAFVGSPSDGSYYIYRKNNDRFNERQTAWLLHVGWLIESSIKRGKSPEWWVKKMRYTRIPPCELTGTSHNISFLNHCLQPLSLTTIRRNIYAHFNNHRI